MARLSDDIINAVKAAGFDVYMRDPAKDTWMIFTDGARIGYLQDSFRGVSLSTVHIPNRTTGTGFNVVDGGLMISDLTRELLSRAFCYAPAWASSRDIETVKKYKNIEAYIASSSFNQEYRKI